MSPAACVADAIRAAAAAVSREAAELTRLDREIGDGDHGANLQRGFDAVVTKLDDSTPGLPAEVLKLVAMTLISTVGGASGPLYGTAFLRASTALGDADELDVAGLQVALTAALGGVVSRGKAEVGEKTMVDALSPAVAAASGATVAEALRAAADAAEAGAAFTVPLVARKGRASYLGERSAGHPDPGATSTALILRAFATSCP